MILLVIDIQRGITDSRLYNFESFISNCQKLIKISRQNHVEIIYFQHDDGPESGFSIGDEEFEISELVYPSGDDKVFIKDINSCFGNKEFEDYLFNRNEKELMMIGLQTDFCMDATIKSAFEKGYRVIVPNNTNSTFDNDYMDKETTYKYYNEMMWPNRFAECISMQEAIELLTR